MKNKSTYLMICLVMPLVFLATELVAQEKIFQKAVSNPTQWYKSGELIVKFKIESSEKAIEEINLRHGARQVSKNPFIGFRKLRVPKEKNVFELAEAYSKNPNVEYAQPNYICRALFIPNDEYYSYQWHFPLINTEQAWDIETGDPNIVVAVADTGVAYENYRRRWRRYYLAPDLAGTNFVQGYDYIENDSHPNDDEGHGTHITGTIAQTTNNSTGVAGIAFNCSIMPVKVLDRTGSGTADSLADGITFAADNGAKIINMSLGFDTSITPEDIPVVGDAVQYAYNKGCVLVASSGNDGVDIVSLPAAYPEVIAVGAVHSGDARADYSQYGPELELVAPGGDEEDRDGNGYIDGVLQQTFGNNTKDWGYWFYAGTSCSAPHVSAVAALLLSQHPALSNEEVRDLLRSTAVDLGPPGRDDEYGYGRIDAYAAVTGEVVSNTPPVISGLPDQLLDEDTSLNNAFNLNDYASDPDEGDVLTYNIVGNTNPNCGVSIDDDDNIDINPTADWNGQSQVTIQVSDGQATDTDAFTITVEPVNDPPTITSTPVTTATEGVLYTYDVQASDLDAGDTLTYSLTTAPLGMTINPTTGLIEWIPTNAQTGDNAVTVTVEDSSGASDTQSFTITVSQAPPPPVAEFVGEPTSGDAPLTVQFTDKSTESITSWSWDFGDGENSTQQNPSHTYQNAGDYTVTLTVAGPGGSDTETKTNYIHVEPASAATAHVTIDMSKQSFWRWWRATAEVTVRQDNALGPPIQGAKVEGHWSDSYSGNVSGTTNGNGKVSFRTGWIRNSGTATFTVDKVTKNGQEYILDGETSDSISR